MKATVKKLLASLHSAVFDKDAYGVNVFGVNHPVDDYRFKIVGDILSAIGNTDFTYDLKDFTFLTLSLALRVDGFVVDDLDIDFENMPATVLIDDDFIITAATGDPSLHPQVKRIIDLTGLQSPAAITASLQNNGLTLSATMPDDIPSPNNLVVMAQSDLIAWPSTGKYGFYFKFQNNGANKITSNYLGFGNIDMKYFNGVVADSDYFMMPGFTYNQATQKITVVSLGNPLSAHGGIKTLAIPIVLDVDIDTEYCIALNQSAGAYGVLSFYTSLAPNVPVVTWSLTSPIDPNRLYLGFDAVNTANVGYSSVVKFLSTPSVIHSSVNQLEAGYSFSTGVYFRRFTNLLYSLLHGFALEVDEVKASVGRAIAQLNFRTSQLDFLDFWGKLFKIPRKSPGEADSSYRTRLKVEAVRQRNNVLAIEAAIFDQTGKDVRLEEPWRRMFILSGNSALSGGHGFYDGQTIGPHLLQPVAYELGIPVFSYFTGSAGVEATKRILSLSYDDNGGWTEKRLVNNGANHGIRFSLRTVGFITGTTIRTGFVDGVTGLTPVSAARLIVDLIYDDGTNSFDVVFSGGSFSVAVDNFAYSSGQFLTYVLDNNGNFKIYKNGVVVVSTVYTGQLNSSAQISFGIHRVSSPVTVVATLETSQPVIAGVTYWQSPCPMIPVPAFSYWKNVYPIILRNKSAGVIALPVDGDQEIEALIDALDDYTDFVNVYFPTIFN